MTACKPILDALPDLAARASGDIPDWAAAHLAGCAACTKRLQAGRLTAGLLQSVAVPIDPPDDFAMRIAARLRPRIVPLAEADPWRSAWKLVPAFGALVLALFIVYQTSAMPEPTGLFPTDSLTAGEHLALGAAPPTMDDVLSVILEGGR